MRTKAKAKLPPRGRWEENQAPWYEQNAVYCDGCGMLIPNKNFVVEERGVTCRFCGPDCAKLRNRSPKLNH